MQFARKYRPKVLSDIVGQRTIVQTLKNSFKSDTINQCYLFIGLFGSGKTTVARIVAAMENCLTSPGLNPCGKCKPCLAIYEGTHTDVNEIDAASNAGKVEQIRKLKESALYNPVSGVKTKYFIVDECHRMSPEAEDALLKILEEPPTRVRFILCTTDISKLRPAIQSRCQRHDFRKIYWSEMATHLETIAQKENINIDKSAVNMCAKMAQGSMRSALQHLEKLSNFVSDKHIGIEDAQKLFGSVDEVLYYDLLDQIIGDDSGKPDATTGYKIINRMLSGGAEFDTIYDDISEHFRCLMVALTCTKATEFITLSEEGTRRTRDQIRRCKSKSNSVLGIIQCLKILHETKAFVELNLSVEIALQQWLIESIFAFRAAK